MVYRSVGRSVDLSVIQEKCTRHPLPRAAFCLDTRVTIRPTTSTLMSFSFIYGSSVALPCLNVLYASIRKQRSDDNLFIFKERKAVDTIYNPVEVR